MIENYDKPDLTVAEIAARHKLSRQTVTKLSMNQSGIRVIESPTGVRKRRHRTVRIPHAVYLRALGTITKAIRKAPVARPCGKMAQWRPHRLKNRSEKT